MKPSKIFIILPLTMALLACPHAQAQSPPTTLFNTGVDGSGNLLSDGAVDPHYALVSSPDPSSPGPEAYIFANNNVPGNYYAPNGPSSAWIGPSDSAIGGGNSSPSGYYDYQTTVYLPPNFTSASISGTFAADDSANILLNGQPTGASASDYSRTSYPFSITNGFVSGLNTLDFIVYQGGGQTSLRVEIDQFSVTQSGASPVITWTNPAPILYGIALNSNQLNATANVAGTFAYTPTNGTVLNPGTNTLFVIFTPTDTNDYNSVSDTVSLVVLIPQPTINIQKAVYLTSTNLLVGMNYQIQASSDLINWTNQGSVFTATNSNWQSTNYWNVIDWNQLFFHLQVVP